jgi:integral membrane sensor domain MASE1
VAYYLGGWLGLRLASPHPSVSLVWPPSGIALASLLLAGSRLWSGVFVGAFALGISTTGHFGFSLGIALGNTLEGVVAAYLVGRLASGRHFSDRAGDVFRFILFGALLSSTLSVAFGVTSLALAGRVPWANVPTIAASWWLGDSVSDLVPVPLLLGWTTLGRRRWSALQWVEAILLLLFVMLVAGFVFGDFLNLLEGPYPVSFMVLPCVVWAALRFPQYVSAIAVFLISFITLWGHLNGQGPFIRPTGHESLFLVQAFIAVTAITSLVMSSVVAERKRARDELRALFENTQEAILIADAVRYVDAESRLLRADRVRPGRADPVSKVGTSRRLPPRIRSPAMEGSSPHREDEGVPHPAPGWEGDRSRVPSGGQLHPGLPSVGDAPISRNGSRPRPSARRLNEELEGGVERTAKLREALREIDTFSTAWRTTFCGPPGP